MTHMFAGMLQSCGQLERALSIVLQQVKSHALCRLHAHTGQFAQGLHQQLERVRLSHGDRPFAAAGSQG
jgi:hypothetical protein